MPARSSFVLTLGAALLIAVVGANTPALAKKEQKVKAIDICYTACQKNYESCSGESR